MNKIDENTQISSKLNEKNSHWILPKGFKALGIASGIKSSGNKDLGCIISNPPSRVFAVYTQNPVRAASVEFNHQITSKDHKVSHVLVNSGNANACTGKKGEEDNRNLAKWVKEFLNDSNDVLICSTGLIGEYLPMENIKNGIMQFSDKMDVEPISFAEAILTTDTKTKTTQEIMVFKNGSIHLSGVSKGSGMICPNMATMLGYLMTDLDLPLEFNSKFKRMIQKSFNSISVDGDTSTNDTVLLLSNGGSGLKYHDLLPEEKLQFEASMERHFISLAKQIVGDGEGATKRVEVIVKNALDEEIAKTLCKAISHSSLIKTAFFGNDPNWGRVLVTLGSHYKELKPELLSVSFCGTYVFEKGGPVDFDRDLLVQGMKKSEVELVVDLGLGDKSWTAWTCDLSYEYVKINAEYHT